MPETWCSDGYGLVEEHEMRSDQRGRIGDRERVSL